MCRELFYVDLKMSSTWKYRGSWWRGRTCRGAAPRGRWGGWSPPAAGRTPWGRAGCWWTGWPSPRSRRGGRTRARWGRRCPCRGWWGSRCRTESSSSWWCWRWCPGRARHSTCRTSHSWRGRVVSCQFCHSTVQSVVRREWGMYRYYAISEIVFLPRSGICFSALLPAAKLPHIYHLIFSICSLGQNNKGHLPFF